MKDKKVLILVVVITVILLFTVGVTYAFLNYSQTGTSNSQLIVGDIYMHYNETNELTITNAMPYSVSYSYSYKRNSNMTEEEVNACVTYFETSDDFGPVFIEYLIANGESIETFCDGTGTVDGLTFQQLLDGDGFSEEELTYFAENNIIIAQEERIAITDYDSSCGSDVIIPKTINDYNVTKIETKAFDDKQLTSVVIPDSVTLIRDYAFRNNQLTSVVIPDTVTSIGDWAFYNNQLTSVIIENGVKIINYEAFADNNLTAVTIPDSVTDLSCYAFDDMVQITKNDDLVCY